MTGARGKYVSRWTRGAAAAALLALQGCTAAPPCEVEPDRVSHAIGNAGCLVVHDGRMLVVRDRRSGRLGLPAGAREPGEAAQCTAARETWEETGFRVRVGGELARFGRDFFLYRCHLAEPEAVVEPAEVPLSGRLEIESVHWLRPETTDPADWRFPGQVPEVLRLFRRASQP